MLALKLDAKTFVRASGVVMALEILSVANKALRRFGGIAPFALIQESDGYLCYVDLPEDKQSWKDMLELLLWKTGANRYFAVSEAWACTLQMGGPASSKGVPLLPIHQLGRREVVWVVAIERTGDCVVFEQQFVRDRNGIKLFKPVCRNGGNFTSSTLPTHWGTNFASGEKVKHNALQYKRRRACDD